MKGHFHNLYGIPVFYSKYLDKIVKPGCFLPINEHGLPAKKGEIVCKILLREKDKNKWEKFFKSIPKNNEK